MGVAGERKPNYRSSVAVSRGLSETCRADLLAAPVSVRYASAFREKFSLLRQ